MALCPDWLCYGQSLSDTERVSINVVTPDGIGISKEAADYLAAKMKQLVATNGMADYGYGERFVLTAKINTLSKDITPTTPTRISQKLEVVFMVGDVMEKKLFETASFTVSGVGTTETKSLISAFQRISAKDKRLTELLAHAKQEIVNYYTNNCDTLITQAHTFASMQQYDKAIYTLITVSDVCHDCYRRCQNAMIPIYTKKINEEGVSLLTKAKGEWAEHPNSEGASRAFKITSAISHRASCYPEVAAFHKAIGEKLRDDEKRKWEFQMKQYEDKQKFKQSIVDACRDIGVAFGKNQPENIVTTVIRGWW